MNKVLHNLEKFCCPLCKGILSLANNTINCKNCNAAFYFHNNTLMLYEKNITQAVTDSYDKLKFLFKKWPKLYNLLVQIISPVYVSRHIKKFLHNNCSLGTFVCNLGSGNTTLHPDCINIDCIAYDAVDVTADIEHIPVCDEVCDGVFIVGVLEHVSNPCAVVSEIHRILKKQGWVYAFYPFMQGYHASPHDYSRLTHEGLRQLFNNFDTVTIMASGGPTSGFLWLFQEWLAMILSLGFTPLFYIWLIVLMVITFPVKFLDIVLIKHPVAYHITSGFTVIAKK